MGASDCVGVFYARLRCRSVSATARLRACEAASCSRRDSAKKVLAIYEPRFIFTPLSLRADGLPTQVTTELPGNEPTMGSEPLDHQVSKLLSLEEEPPSLAQAERLLSPKIRSHISANSTVTGRTGPAGGCGARAFRRQPREQRVPQTSLPRREDRRVERLALAEPQPHPQPRAARAHHHRHRRRARGDPSPRRARCRSASRRIT